MDQNGLDYDARVNGFADCPSMDRLWCQRSWRWSPPEADDLIAENAAAVMAALDKRGGAFFLGVGFHKPHLLWQVRPGAWGRNSGVASGVQAGMRVPPALAPGYLTKKCAPSVGGKTPDGFDYFPAGSCDGAGFKEEDKVQELRRVYMSAVTHTDDAVGRVLEAAKKYVWWDNTIVVTTSDHGFALGENGPCYSPSSYVQVFFHFLSLFLTRKALATLSDSQGTSHSRARLLFFKLHFQRPPPP